MRIAVACVLAAAAGVAALACGSDDSSANGAEAPAAGRFNAERAFRDLEAQVDFGPRPAGSAANRRQTKYLAKRLRAAGVKDVRIQGPHRNVVGVIPGSERGAVVLGAHHDTKNGIPGFVGANDGASGVAVVLELARSLPSRLDGPSIRIALFDAEEARGSRPFTDDGTRGSAQYIRYARGAGRRGSPPLRSIRSMFLFDLVGDCDLQIPLEANSDPGLYALIASASQAADGDAAPFEGNTTPIDDDHVPFLEAGIPAVDLIDFSYGPGGSPGAYWHTADDTIDKVCAESLDAVGEAAVRALG